jgi:hypothetical protein
MKNKIKSLKKNINMTNTVNENLQKHLKDLALNYNADLDEKDKEL